MYMYNICNQSCVYVLDLWDTEESQNMVLGMQFSFLSSALKNKQTNKKANFLCVQLWRCASKYVGMGNGCRNLQNLREWFNETSE